MDGERNLDRESGHQEDLSPVKEADTIAPAAANSSFLEYDEKSGPADSIEKKKKGGFGEYPVEVVLRRRT